jgi:O-antigen/teichoic acid export membrane protein
MTSAASVRGGGGVVLIISATAIAGVAGYAVTFLAFRVLGAAEYRVFAVFWAALYLVVGGLSGIQQEVTRATHPIESGTRLRPSAARNFAIVFALALFAVIVVSSPLWANDVFPKLGEQLVWPLAVGTSAYILVATLIGSLYGVSQWRSIFLMVIVDGLLRLVLVLIAFAFARDIVVVAWAVALPFPLALVLLWAFIRRQFVGRSDLDVGYRALTWNVTRTILASVSTAILVSGFPLILGIAGNSTSAAFVGALIFAITITRAPLIVTVMALQSFFVVRFRDADRPVRRALGSVLLLLIGAGVVLGAIAWLVGPQILSWVSGGSTSIAGETVAILVLSSAIVAGLTVTGSAVLARSRHFAYTLGWVAAAIVTLILMAVPGLLVTRVELALLAGPTAGLVVHLFSFVRLGAGTLPIVEN